MRTLVLKKGIESFTISALTPSEGTMRKHAYKRELIGQVATMLLVIMNILVPTTADATAAQHERVKRINILANEIKSMGLVDQKFA